MAKSTSQKRLPNQNTDTSKNITEDKTPTNVNKTDDISDDDENKSAGGRKVPIVLREPGGAGSELDSDEQDEEEDDELRTSALIFSTGRGFNLR